MSNLCNSCGTLGADGAPYCTNCGAKTTKTVPVAQEAAYPVAPQPEADDFDTVAINPLSPSEGSADEVPADGWKAKLQHLRKGPVTKKIIYATVALTLVATVCNGVGAGVVVKGVATSTESFSCCTTPACNYANPSFLAKIFGNYEDVSLVSENKTTGICVGPPKGGAICDGTQINVASPPPPTPCACLTCSGAPRAPTACACFTCADAPFPTAQNCAPASSTCDGNQQSQGGCFTKASKACDCSTKTVKEAQRCGPASPTCNGNQQLQSGGCFTQASRSCTCATGQTFSPPAFNCGVGQGPAVVGPFVLYTLFLKLFVVGWSFYLFLYTIWFKGAEWHANGEDLCPMWVRLCCCWCYGGCLVPKECVSLRFLPLPCV